MISNLKYNCVLHYKVSMYFKIILSLHLIGKVAIVEVRKQRKLILKAINKYDNNNTMPLR